MWRMFDVYYQFEYSDHMKTHLVQQHKFQYYNETFKLKKNITSHKWKHKSQQKRKKSTINFNGIQVEFNKDTQQVVNYNDGQNTSKIYKANMLF